MARRVSPLLFFCLAGLVCGCASSGVTEFVGPPVVPSAAPFDVPAMTRYEGPSELVPRPLIPRRDEEITPFRYRISVDYERDEASRWLQTLGMLYYLAYPIGTLYVHAVGVLELVEFGVVVREYRAECWLEQRRILQEEHSTPTGLRYRALFEVRNNLEAQLARDRDFLTAFFREELP